MNDRNTSVVASRAGCSVDKHAVWNALAFGKTPTESGSRIERMGRHYLLKRFGELTGGTLAIEDADGQQLLGAGNGHDDLRVNVTVLKQAFYLRTLLGGTIGSAESYMDGQWKTSDLTSLIRILIRNIDSITRLDRTWSKIRNVGHRLWHTMRPNTIDGSRKNIQEHYDLGNEFYQQFLDPTMNYSSGIFPQNADSMLHSSLFKMNWICEKLQLSKGDHVLEIGSGWGGLACFMAQQFGCRVTTTTISPSQFEFAQKQVRQAGLENRVSVICEDYRNLKGRFDKLVSVEMIEAVGHAYFDQYFTKCNALLKEDGLMLLQGITMSQQNYQQHLKNIDFIRRYIFPGGCLPSVVAIGQSIGQTGNMRMVHLEDITVHYSRTLQQWRHRFFGNIQRIRELGYGDRFVRMWHFYLCYCEAAFSEQRVNAVQVVFAKPGSKVDPAIQYSRLGSKPFDFSSLDPHWMHRARRMRSKNGLTVPSNPGAIR